MNKEINNNQNFERIINMSPEEINNIFKDYSLMDVNDLLKLTYGSVIDND